MTLNDGTNAENSTLDMADSNGETPLPTSATEPSASSTEPDPTAADAEEGTTSNGLESSSSDETTSNTGSVVEPCEGAGCGSLDVGEGPCSLSTDCLAGLACDQSSSTCRVVVNGECGPNRLCLPDLLCETRLGIGQCLAADGDACDLPEQCVSNTCNNGRCGDITFEFVVCDVGYDRLYDISRAECVVTGETCDTRSTTSEPVDGCLRSCRLNCPAGSAVTATCEFTQVASYNEVERATIGDVACDSQVPTSGSVSCNAIMPAETLVAECCFGHGDEDANLCP